MIRRPEAGDGTRGPAAVDAALRESEARYRSALTAGRMGSWETDLVRRTRTWTPEGMALFGLDLPAGRGSVGGDADEYAAAIHPDDRAVIERLHELADRLDSFAAEYRIVRPDGTTLWLAGRGLVVARRADGRARRLVSIMADVTERRQAEEILRIERERLDLALQAGQMGVFDYDLRTDLLWWSRQTYAVFGVDPGAFVPTGRSVGELIHPDDRAMFLRRRAEAIQAREPLQVEFRVVRPDGRVAWVGHRGQSEYDADGRPVRSFGVAVDITERKEAERALQEADRKKDDFIATLAHELRNPLAPIRNAVSVLRRHSQADPQVAWCRDVIERQVAQMSRLLEDLLDVSRVTRGQFRLRRGVVDLAAVLEQAIEIAAPVIEQAGHALVVTPAADRLPVDGDSTRLAQVFSNLLINAAKYTRRPGRIEVVPVRDGVAALVTVRDTGIGIAPERLPGIFEMFGQSARSLEQSADGLGIGLSLAKGLVDMHGGTITAHSAGIGQGSAFQVRLPLAGAAPQAQPEAGAGFGAAARPKSRCILVADDLRESADSLAMLLEMQGHRVHVAYDGAQAVEMAAAHRPDVVLLDLGMPRVNGYDACRTIRSQPGGAAMVLIAQTGWGQERDRRQTREAGFDHHLVKPIDPDALEALLQSAVPRATGAPEGP